MERRGFIKTSFIHASTGFLTALAALPAGLQLCDPLFKHKAKPGEWIPIGTITNLPPDRPTSMVLTLSRQDGWERITQQVAVFVVPNEEQPRVFSSVCPHLGCPIHYDNATHHFVCSCHQSIWNRDGEKMEGPSPRGMDPLPVKIEEGTLSCRWLQYQPGLSERKEV
jgi:Rieske Fe-S protein